MGDFAGVVESCFAGHLQGDERVRSEPGAPFFAFDRDGLSPETTESAAGPVPDDDGEPVAAVAVAMFARYLDGPDEGVGESWGAFVYHGNAHFGDDWCDRFLKRQR